MCRQLGPDAGFDSICDTSFGWTLARLLDALDITHKWLTTILYCLNPKDNEVFATLCGNFPGRGVTAKAQFGSGGRVNDQQDGMLRQLTTSSQIGLLSQFVVMLTDEAC